MLPGMLDEEEFLEQIDGDSEQQEEEKLVCSEDSSNFKGKAVVKGVISELLKYKTKIADIGQHNIRLSSKPDSIDLEVMNEINADPIEEDEDIDCRGSSNKAIPRKEQLEFK